MSDETVLQGQQQLPSMIERKILFWQRISAFGIMGVCTVALVTAIILVPQISETLTQVNEATDQVETAVEGINSMTAELKDASANVNKLLRENSEAMAGAVKKVSEIDYEGLNKAISDLQSAVGPLASFLGRFR
ncbi:MAG: hypothetical protein K6E91_01050 [Butyrivibrio sp.]|nr:hypothetical protein [Butyrivibrio sp.]